ncbi:hypothetical protein SO802_020695 [Lithocarpus litseifolius]|uniref:Uncharacterized protein n=1 Tax=Lithocarpus litseifolius TaxID=425828 RepID=A0AAW2CCS2_9ROSI
MTSLSHLDLSGNNFNSSVPNWLYSFSRLEFLNLGGNNLQGTISSVIGNLTSVISIDLSLNKLGGKLPRSLDNLCNLREIRLSSNKWSQEISEILESLSGYLSDRLEILDLSDSQLHGHLTDELWILNLHSNNFHGQIPKELCALTSLQILDLSHNKLSGAIPGCVKNFSAMAAKNNSNPGMSFFQLNVYYGETVLLESELLMIKGKALEYSTILHLVKCIDFSKNNLSGEIPKEITNLQGLQSLNLSYNLLIESIPEDIGAMGSLESIDFSMNQLFGQIPSSISSLTFLNCLNLSNNNLTGKIPLSTQLQSFNASGFIGNKLCGLPLSNKCTIDDVDPNNENKGSKHNGELEVDWFFVILALGFVVGFWGVRGPLLLNKQWRIMYFQFLDHTRYKLKSLVLL